MLRQLDWDSKFFGYKVGESTEVPDKSVAKKDGYRIIYIKSPKPLPLDLFCDHKINFSKEIKPVKFPEANITSVKGQPLTDHLLELSLLSGIYSRFNLDKNFSHGEFKKLYTEWIQKSLSGELADEVFVCGDLGFVTVKIKNGNAHIGLIAVSANAQGKGVGKLLLAAAESFASSQKAHTLFVPTQLTNKPACKFYESYGFQEFSSELTYHLWID